MVPIAGWVTTGPMTAWAYGALGDRPDHTFAASINGGTNFFSGGPGGIAGTPTASQKIDVAGAAAEVDLGDVAATLSAYIGGYTVSGDLPQIDASFHDAAGARLGGIRIGPVNREQRKRMTTLLKHYETATLPKLTRRIDVAISVTVDNNGKNHAYVDNVSLTLAKSAVPTPPAAAKPTLAVACAGKTIVAKVRPAKGSVVTSVDVPRQRPAGRDRQEGAVLCPHRKRWAAGAAEGRGAREVPRQDHRDAHQTDAPLLTCGTRTKPLTDRPAITMPSSPHRRRAAAAMPPCAGPTA